MKILICLNKIPCDLEDGFNLRVYNIIKNLIKYNRIVVLVRESWDKNKIEWFKHEIKNLEILNNKNLVIGKKDRKILSDVFSIFDKRILKYNDFDYGYYYKIKNSILQESIDAVMTFHITNVPYLYNLNSVITIADIIDDPIKIIMLQKNIITRLKSILWTYCIYKRMIKNCDLLLSATENDSYGIKKSTKHPNLITVPNGVNYNYFYPIDEGEKASIIFTGNMDYLPNVNAILYFYERIWPKVKKENESVELWVVGKNPTEKIREMGKRCDRIKITGYVKDIRDYLGKATLVIAPMIDGAGIKNKILEAWAMGKPVVATNLAVHGLFAINGENIFVSDIKNDISRIISELLKNEGLRLTIGRNARKHVKKNYSWDSQAKKISKAIEQVNKIDCF